MTQSQKNIQEQDKPVNMEDIIDSESKEKALYLIQIQYLEDRLESCQLKHEELGKQTMEQASLYNELEDDKKDTTELLKRTLVSKEKKAKELAEQIESKQQKDEQDREAVKLQHSQHMKELHEHFHELKSEKMMLVAKLQELEESEERLILQRPSMSDIELLMKELDCHEEKHLAAIDRLKKETELEKEKMMIWKQYMADRVVEQKTSQILRVERAHHRERLEMLPFLLNKNLTLLREKDVLRDKVRDLCCERDHLKKDLKDNIRESFTCKEEVEQRTKEWQQLKVELKDRSVAHKNALAEKETLRQQLASLSKQSRQKAAEAVQLRPVLQRESSRRRQLEGVMQEAVIVLRHILMDSEKVSERKTLRLLEILESSAVPGSRLRPQQLT
ncbi:protein MLP1-like [Sebastes umbrosus]|uniref:protein MLP1-like n=1 Tax=Sebastes umbrosus TaxID=72105 RepID=UPI00189D3C8D|nr:protein MLP1-like [Sebastes umbrosus]